MRYEGPTWCLAAAIYAIWFGLIWHHEQISWPVLWLAGGLVTAWHNSLVHESVHALIRVPRWLKTALAFPPLGVWYPYFVYHRTHSNHHRDSYLTDPLEDPESFYFSQADWDQLAPAWKKVMLFNQTFIGRMLLGPPFAVYGLITCELIRLKTGDRDSRVAWVSHTVSLAVLFAFVSGVAGLPWWQYLLFFAHPGLALTMVRSFYEHRAADDKYHRCAAVESGPFFGMLFLYNNLHVLHHLKPTMPWYEMPAYYRANRDELIAHNGGYVFSGYGEVVRRFLFRPTFTPVHPDL